jgi:TPP-dependent pyruvate/acetoin dehydrogenase alpha subunit
MPDHARLLAEIGADGAISMFRTMVRIREFEERIRFLFLEGKMPGTVHQYIGQEACASGVCAALRSDDVVVSTHRPHGHAIARGLSMRSLMAELYGKREGCCRGKGGSMHVGDLGLGMLPAIAIVGGNIPIAVGVALAFKMRGEKRVAVSFFGDGAANEGAFHEGLNMAAVYDAPVLFVCENNLYGASTSVKRVMRIQDIARRAEAYGMQASIADGMDVLDVYAKARVALEHARALRGPVLLELKTFRLCGHSRRDSNTYMEEQEKAHWKSRDPIPFAEKLLLERFVLTEQRVAELRKEVADEVADAVAFAQAAEDPAAEELYEDLYSSCEVPR